MKSQKLRSDEPVQYLDVWPLKTNKYSNQTRTSVPDYAKLSQNQILRTREDPVLTGYKTNISDVLAVMEKIRKLFQCHNIWVVFNSNTTLHL